MKSMRYKKALQRVSKDKRYAITELIAVCDELIQMGANSDTIKQFTNGISIADVMKKPGAVSKKTILSWNRELSKQRDLLKAARWK